MQNPKPLKESWEDVDAPSQPVQRKSLSGISAKTILPEAGSVCNRRGQEAIGPVLARVYRIVLAWSEGRP